MKTIQCLFMVAMLGGLAPAAQAGSIFGNGDFAFSTGNGGRLMNANNGYAIPFTTGNTTAADLLTIDGAFALLGENTGGDVTVTARIYAATLSDGNGGPTGGPLASGSMFLPGNSTLDWQSFAFSSPVTLTTGTNYYFAIERSVPFTNISWRIPDDNPTYSDLGSGSSYAITPVTVLPQNVWRLNSSSVWVDDAVGVSGHPMGFQLVPEPSTYALAGIAAAAFGSLAWRRKWRRPT